VAMRAFVLGMPRRMLTAVVVFAGVMANVAADAGIVILPPIAAMLFAATGRHPLAGIAAAFAGVAGGFSANLLPSTLDVLLAGFTQEAVNASKLLPDYEVQLLGNYWFMIAATPLLTVLGAWITHAFVEPRLGAWKSSEPLSHDAPTAQERRGLWVAGIATAVFLGVLVWLALPGGALHEDGDTWVQQLKPFFESMVLIVMLLFFVPGLAYGLVTRKIRNDHDVARMTSDTIATMGGYIVLAFAAAQFVSYFAWSNLGAILAISGAQTLKGMGLEGAPLLVGLVLFAAALNVFLTSASAKWAILAPVFVPMFTLLGFTPEGTQAVFRIGDSSTNIITPLMPYMPFVLAAAQRYDPRAGTGTIVAMMIPYSIAFLMFWTMLLLAFYLLGWPIGPGVGIRLPG
jgi:aminobenzoyl-glutamate transport protein